MIVFDSSTLILLAKIEILDLLLNDYHGEITIPESVEKECTVKDTFDGLLIKKRISERKIKIKAAEMKETERLMADFNLDIGEGESIMLALRNNCSLATDDRNAMRACKLLKVQFITAVDILIRAHEKKLLVQESAMIKLGELAKHGRYKKSIIADAKKMLYGGK